MSKTCAICGQKINFMSENNLGKDHKNIKICFTCYEYTATAMKGNKKAVEILKSRYRDDISPKVTKYIDSFDVDIIPKKEEQKDEFMDLMNNDLSKTQSKVKEKCKEKQSHKSNIIRLDKLSDAKKDKLIRIKIVSTILTFMFLLLGSLFSFYILTQGYGGMLSLVMFIVSVGFACVFGFIRTILATILGV